MTKNHRKIKILIILTVVFAVVLFVCFVSNKVISKNKKTILAQPLPTKETVQPTAMITVIPAQKIRSKNGKIIKLKELVLCPESVEGISIDVFRQDANLTISEKKRDIIREGAVKEFTDFINLQKGEYIADIGTGLGNYVLAFSEEVGPSGKIIASDINPNCEIYGRWKLNTTLYSGLYEKQLKGKNIGRNIQFQTNRRNNIDLKTKVDVVTLLNVHLFNHATKLSPESINTNREIALSIINSLKADGRIIIIDYYKAGHKNLPFKKALKQTIGYFPNCEVTRHQLFSIKDNWAETYGIEIRVKKKIK